MMLARLHRQMAVLSLGAIFFAAMGYAHGAGSHRGKDRKPSMRVKTDKRAAKVHPRLLEVQRATDFMTMLSSDTAASDLKGKDVVLRKIFRRLLADNKAIYLHTKRGELRYSAKASWRLVKEVVHHSEPEAEDDAAHDEWLDNDRAYYTTTKIHREAPLQLVIRTGISQKKLTKALRNLALERVDAALANHQMRRTKKNLSDREILQLLESSQGPKAGDAVEKAVRLDETTLPDPQRQPQLRRALAEMDRIATALKIPDDVSVFLPLKEADFTLDDTGRPVQGWAIRPRLVLLRDGTYAQTENTTDTFQVDFGMEAPQHTGFFLPTALAAHLEHLDVDSISQVTVRGRRSAEQPSQPQPTKNRLQKLLSALFARSAAEGTNTPSYSNYDTYRIDKDPPVRLSH